MGHRKACLCGIINEEVDVSLANQLGEEGLSLHRAVGQPGLEPLLGPATGSVALGQPRFPRLSPTAWGSGRSRALH